ncbi:hypothetical protein PG997_014226 [Apiospora hydei]|uniref:Fungal N-terminal domain-containing protein n=1 Tax=Apiospora hydei TaxID=1337664 RepID=A0ABR1UT68_9PEZI
MADPLSVAGLAAGLVSLGIQVTGGLVSYLDAIRNREEDLALATQYAGSIQAAIHHISTSPSCAQASETASASIMASIDACEAQLKALGAFVGRLSSSQVRSSTLRHKMRTGSKKLLYAFYRPGIKELEDRLARAECTLQGAMQALGLDVQYSMNETLTAVRADAGHTRASVQSVASELLLVQSESTLANAHLREIGASLPAVARDAAKLGPLIMDQVDVLGLRLDEQQKAISSGFMKHMQMSTENSFEVMRRFDGMEALLRGLEEYFHPTQDPRASLWNPLLPNARAN